VSEIQRLLPSYSSSPTHGRDRRYDNLFRLPNATLQDIIGQIRKFIPASQGPLPASNYSHLYNLEPGLVYPSSAGDLDPTLRISLLNGPTITIPTHEIIRPLRGLDQSGAMVLDTGYNEVQIYGNPAPEDGPVMGKALLSQVNRYASRLP